VVIGVDARDGRVTTRGWLNSTDLDAVEFCRTLADHGVRRAVYTDVGRDGLLKGPNLETTREVAKVVKTIGSGGVSTVDHLKQLAEAGAEGAIIGTALYEGRLKLVDALAIAC
jgi:phosphoribosylformimino-5-aminoimidazole carboxamide ribotide isomerase